jgi:phosphate transport system substrate-binding protein
MLARRTFITLAAASFALAACGPRPATDRGAAPAAPATRIRVSGSGTALPAVQKLGEGYAALAPDIRLELPGGVNSGGAIRGVLEGSLEVAVTNRPLSEAEAREPLLYVPFVRDAVAFAVHRSVAVPSLRTADVRDLYSGTTATWQSVGGPDATVIVLDRDEDESMRKLTLVPMLAGRPVATGAITLTSAPDMLAALDTTPQAIGYTSLGLLRLRAPKNIVPVALDEVMPSPATVASGAYPWSLTFGLVIRADAAPTTQAFVEHVARSARAVLGPFEYEALDG